ncbi:hypothetical protein LCGC14_0380690 [marine sediment metagenome]|uniref:Uncharacterized protein n=1 Tax=marine sediment metagenome TaxID=412755 RepID=A0A0F9WBB9_9ZZZZ
MRLVETNKLIERSKLKRPLKYYKFHQNLTDEDFDVMYDDLKKTGQKIPVSLDRDCNLLDGYTRDEILGLLKSVTILYNQYSFSSESEKLGFIVSVNRKRRHLSIYQKCQWGLPVYDQAKKEAVTRQKKGTLASQDAKGKAAAIAAKAAGVSTPTFERFVVINDSPARVNKQNALESGKTTIKTVYNLLTKEERSLPKTKIPKGSYDVILCDVPIAFIDKGGRGAAENHYSTIPPHKLMKLKIPSADNAIIFFWMSPSIMYYEIPVTTKFAWAGGKNMFVRDIPTPTYKAILDAWGFKIIKNEYVWDKEIIGVGSWVRNQHENCIIAIKGNMPTPAKLFSSIIKERRSQHSKKPEKLYEIIEQMYPKRNYLELYARRKRKGWSSHGNEIKKKVGKFA